MTANYNGNELHYIASGLSFIYVPSMNRDTEPHMVDWIRDSFTKMQYPNNKFGILYNAFVESNFGKTFSANYRDVVCDIHADSGGLQMVTIGKEATSENKKTIYKSQADNSTVAMSFDEIPVNKIFDPTSKDGATASSKKKVYMPGLLKEKATKSGENLKEQLEFFLEYGTVSRPLLIAQGNDIQSFIDWTNYVQDAIPDELLQGLGGVAVAGATLGIGTLENFIGAFVPKVLELRFPAKQYHYLGVGSFDRLLPILALVKSGVYKDTVFSYDSTTHTSGIARARFYSKLPDGKFTGIRLLASEGYRLRNYEHIMKGIASYDIGYDDPEMLYKLYITHGSYSALKNSNEEHLRDTMIKTKIALFRYSYDNLVKQIEEYMEADTLFHGVKRPLQLPIDMLSKCHTRRDFDHWYGTFRDILKSDRVRSHTQNLESLFG